MECVPPVKEDVVNVAWAVSSSMAVPMVVVPSTKKMVPDGTPPVNVDVTAAVNVTGCPAATGFAEEMTVVVVA